MSTGARTAAPLAAGAATRAAGRRSSDCGRPNLRVRRGAAAIIAAVVANAGQSIELVRSKRIVGVSVLFLILAVANQALWLSWAILVPDIATRIFATVTGIITVFNLTWWSLRMLGLRPFWPPELQVIDHVTRKYSDGPPAAGRRRAATATRSLTQCRPQPFLEQRREQAMAEPNGSFAGKIAVVTGAVPASAALRRWRSRVRAPAWCSPMSRFSWPSKISTDHRPHRKEQR